MSDIPTKELYRLAGLFEGEGCFLVAAAGEGIPSGSLEVQLGDKAVCEYFQRYFGGSVCLGKAAGTRTLGNINRTQIYRWREYSDRTIGIAEQLVPLLMGHKAVQGQAFLTFQKRRQAIRQAIQGGRLHIYTTEERLELYELAWATRIHAGGSQPWRSTWAATIAKLRGEVAKCAIA